MNNLINIKKSTEKYLGMLRIKTGAGGYNIYFFINCPFLQKKTRLIGVDIVGCRFFKSFLLNLKVLAQYNFITACSSKWFELDLPAIWYEPGIVEQETQILPLCYAAPHKRSLRWKLEHFRIHSYYIFSLITFYYSYTLKFIFS